MVRWKASSEHHVALRLDCLGLDLDRIAKRITFPPSPLSLFPQKGRKSSVPSPESLMPSGTTDMVSTKPRVAIALQPRRKRRPSAAQFVREACRGIIGDMGRRSVCAVVIGGWPRRWTRMPGGPVELRSTGMVCVYQLDADAGEIKWRGGLFPKTSLLCRVREDGCDL